MGKLKVKIPGQVQFNGRKQVEDLQNLLKNNLIQKFKKETSRVHSAKMEFTFNLCRYFLEMPEGQVEGDFSNYRIKIKYGGNMRPQVFVISHNLDKKCPHIYDSGMLCLYKPSIFKWRNQNSIALDIVPLIYSWLYFYEKWIKVGNWLGPEAPH